MKISCGSYNSGEEERADRSCLSSLALSPSSIESDDSELPPPPPPDVSPSSFTSPCHSSDSPHNYASRREDRTTQSHKNSQSSYRHEDSIYDDQERRRHNDVCHFEDGKRYDVSTLFPESIRFDYSSIPTDEKSFSSHFNCSRVISTSSSVSTRQPTNTSIVPTQLDPPAKQNDSTVNDALQTCSLILKSFCLRCAFDHWRREIEILSCSISILSADSIEVTSISSRLDSPSLCNHTVTKLKHAGALSTIGQLVLKSVKKSAFSTLKSHMNRTRRFNKAVVLLDHVIQQATVRRVLYRWANTVWEQGMLETQTQMLLTKTFDSWRKLVVATMEMRQRLWQMTIFNRWRLITDESIELRQKEYVALVHWANCLSRRAFVALSLHVKESKEEKSKSLVLDTNKSVDFSFGGRGQYVASRYVTPSNQSKYSSNTAKSFISYRSPNANRTHSRLGQSQTSPPFRLTQPTGRPRRQMSPPMQRKYAPSSKSYGLDYESRGSIVEQRTQQQQTVPRPSIELPSTGYYSQDRQYHNDDTDRRLFTTDLELERPRTSNIMMNANVELPIPSESFPRYEQQVQQYQQQHVYHHRPVFSYNNNRSSHNLVHSTAPSPSLKSIRNYYQERFVISNLLDEMVTTVEQRQSQYYQSANQPQPRTLHQGIASLFNM